MSWTHESEVNYLKGLVSRYSSHLDRLYILEGYLKSIDKRNTWGALKKEALREFVIRELTEELRRGVEW